MVTEHLPMGFTLRKVAVVKDELILWIEDSICDCFVTDLWHLGHRHRYMALLARISYFARPWGCCGA